MDDKRLKAHQLLNLFILAKTSDEEQVVKAFNAVVTYLLENFDSPSTDNDVLEKQRKDSTTLLEAEPKLTGPQLLRIMRIDPPVMDDVVWTVSAMRLMVGIINVPPAARQGKPYHTWALRFANVLI